MWGKYEELRPAQIESIRAKAPIAYIPWGALEWHGVHNPIGLDGLKAHGILLALAALTGGVVLPPVYVGTETIKPFKGFKHTLDFPPELVRDLARQFIDQLVDEGFRLIVILSGHYSGGHTAVLREVGVEASLAHPDCRVWITSDCFLTGDDYPPNHAALGETSFQLYFNPALVDISQLPRDRPTSLDVDGIMGEDPLNSSAELGCKQLDVILATAASHIRTMLGEMNLDPAWVLQ